MKIQLSDLWRLDGPLGRGAYAFWGFVLAGLKYNLDRLLAASFGREWTPFSYLRPAESTFSVTALTPAESLFYGALVALAIPFVWAGVAMSVRRLRTLGLQPWLVVFFFIPLANVFFFLLLAVLPDRPAAAEGPDGRMKAWLDAFIPHGWLGSGALAVAVTAVIGVLLTIVAVNAAGEYGWGLFVGLPFMLGLNAALIHGWHAPRSLGSCLAAGAGAVSVLGLGLLALAVEGVICLAMAAPIGLVLALLGATVGWTLQSRRWGQGPTPLPPAMVLLVAVLPLLMAAEARDPLPPPLFAVTTTVEVDAPPARVWDHVVSFSDLPPPTELVFKLGVAHPVRARIEGTGVGAVRKCEFSTGPFVEPITVWDAPRRLAFDVVAQPRPMRELSPYPGVDAPHLDSFLRSERGQFLLTALPGGRTRLEGTTWYRHRIWPAPYWRVWSDLIIHGIHARVLDHVKRLSEAPALSSR